MRYLPRALASLRAQTHSRWEGLIIDDGSTDSSWEMLARAAAEDARIVPIRLGSNGGPAAARNAGLSRARGDWIAYLDCDDVFYPGHLGRLAQREVPGEVLVFAYDVYQEPGEGQPSRYLHTWDPIVKRDRMWIRNPSTPLGIAHRRDLLARVGLFDEQISYQEDWDLWKRMARAGAVFLFSPERSGRYHLRADGQSRTRRIPDALR